MRAQDWTDGGAAIQPAVAAVEAAEPELMLTAADSGPPHQLPQEDGMDPADEGTDDDSDCEGQEQQRQVGLEQQCTIPAQPPGAFHPSVGSAGHAQGTCKRCCFFPRGRCMNGYSCEFCHYTHEMRKRKSKKGREKVTAK